MNEKEIRDCCYVISRDSSLSTVYLKVIPPLSRVDINVTAFISSQGLDTISCSMGIHSFEKMYRNLNLVYGQGDYREHSTYKECNWNSDYYNVYLYAGNGATSISLSYTLNDKGREKYLKPDTYGL